MNLPNWSGVITALATPFIKGEVDCESLTKLIDFQIRSGVGDFVVNGTTAESPTLSRQEVEMIYKQVRETLPKTSRIILGTGSNSTAKTIANGKLAKELGADACLVVVPYYNKPTQKGLLKHFLIVAESSDLPVILYNVPSRTVAKLELDTIAHLSQHPNIVGIKEASGDIEFLKEIKKVVPEDFSLLSGDDFTIDEFVRNGGHGVISVFSHIIPGVLAEYFLEIFSEKPSPVNLKRYDRLCSALFEYPNPVPVKRALFQMGIFRSDEVRLPLVSLEDDESERIIGALNEVGL
ncbi:MAG: 4-hydroxy-tetrahydrodipicolinate synthase [Bdellovibrionales bacterium CG10_big_fil_rev_8_21_14_0_10_45_34]|nr:MAG: 4-hydroxy-tetrahydrodipicolinate synthase [Bdellovibrionales bacterium CG10_big_fil_rev_8_21_14_0_10_45_34]